MYVYIYIYLYTYMYTYPIYLYMSAYMYIFTAEVKRNLFPVPDLKIIQYSLQFRDRQYSIWWL